MLWFVLSLCLSVWGWYAKLIFLLMPNCSHNSSKNLLVNLMSQSKTNTFGTPMKGKARSLYNHASSTAPIILLQGSRITALVAPWSVMVKIESLPFDVGSFVIRSMVIVLNGSLSFGGVIGYNGRGFGCMFDLFC